MAKPKQRVLVKIHLPCYIHVWIDEPAKKLQEIMALQGIAHVNIIGNTSPILITIDPRYNINEIASEIRDLLVTEGPNIQFGTSEDDYPL